MDMMNNIIYSGNEFDQFFMGEYWDQYLDNDGE